jgi:hypothetical protein
MATWTTVPDSSLEPGKPIRSIDALALRDNPVAIAEGASGAPKIDPFAAFEHNGQAGAVGTYAFAASTTTSDVAFGSTRAGSNLRTASAAYVHDNGATQLLKFALSVGDALSGTWRCMGNYDYSTTGVAFGATLWLRIA